MQDWLIEAIGAAAAIAGTVCWLPQAVKTIRSRDTASLSLASNALLLTSVVMWLLYGLATGIWPLIAANIISTVLVGAIVYMKITEDRRKTKPSDKAGNQDL